MGKLDDGRSSPSSNPVIAYRNPAFDGVFGADNAATGFPAGNARSYGTYEGWRPTGASSALEVTLAATQSITYCAALCFGAGATTTVQPAYSTDGGSSWTDVGNPLDADEGALLWLFDSISGVTDFRWTVDDGNIAGFRLAVAMVGQFTAMQRSIYVGHTPIRFGRRTTLAANRAESGAFLGRILRRETLATQVRLDNLTPAYYRDTLDPLFVAMQLQPAFWAWRPVSLAADDVSFAWVRGDPEVVNQRPNGMMSASFELGSGDFR